MPETEVTTEFMQGLYSLEGKRVKVRVRVQKDVDTEPGVPIKEDNGYYYVDLFGVVQKPAIQYFPAGNEQGQKVLYIQSWDGKGRVYAIVLTSIDEVDDEFEEQVTKEMAVAGLAKRGQ